MGNEILRLIRHSSLACHGRERDIGDEVEAIATLHPLTGDVIRAEQEMFLFPATHYVAGPERMERAIGGIEAELARGIDKVRAVLGRVLSD